MLGWNLSADSLSDLKSRTLNPGWDDRLYINSGAIFIPTVVALQTRKGIVLCKALACRRRAGVSSLWHCVDYSLKDLGKTSNLPDSFLPFFSVSGAAPYENAFPQLLDAPALAHCPSWICGGFLEMYVSSEGKILRKHNSDVSLSVLYDAA
jgi:hypothetical protein